jgi:peptide/nickel transport system substrate-binding protein
MSGFEDALPHERMATRLNRRTLLRAGTATGASLAMLGLLAACGGDDDDDDDAAPTTATGDATPTAASGVEATATSGASAPTATAGTSEPTATAASSGDAQQGGELIYALANRIDTLDPTITTFSDSVRMANHMFDPLVWQPQPGEFIPGLATSWEVAETADQYTFTLRDDVTYHDGSPLTADAIKFTYDRIVDPNTKSQVAFSALGPYESTDVTDPQTATVNFTKPYAPFLNSVSSVLLTPLPPAVVQELGFDFGIQPVGTGPFIFDAYQTDTQVRMVRNPDYNWGPTMFKHEGPAYLDAITWRIIPEGATRLAALQSGEIHMMQNVPTQDYATVQEDDSLAIIDAVLPGSGWSMMNNVTRAPNDDLKVRQALEYGVDKEGLIQVVWQGLYKVSDSPLTSVTFAYDPSTADIYSYDPDMAGQLLDEAGWTMGDGNLREKDGQPLVMGLYYRSDNPDFVALATYLQAQYAEIGIEIELNGLAQAGYFDAVRAGEHNLQFWWGPATDPDGVFRVFFHSSNADGGTNRNRYVDAEMDALIDEAAGTTDTERRQELYVELQHKALNEAIMVFFSEPSEVYAYQKDVVVDPLVTWAATVPLFYDTWLQS